MQRSSEAIGTIAAALAKAQLELTNPEKSLTGTLPGMTPAGDRIFRYAPLSSGLDLVRKTLGRHEIATVQTTAIDDSAGLVRLTTVLAHSSGEWVSSEWPVCPVSETASPQRMGAALTYARRYALFTLVGIAGEDDLDAPDLSDSKTAHTQQPNLDGTAPSPNGSPNALASSRRSRRSPGPKPLLQAEESAATRDKLQRELEALGSEEELVAWATRILPIKNSLRSHDAFAVEQAFATKMLAFESQSPDTTGTSAQSGPLELIEPELKLPKTRRRRDKRHLEYVASKPCLVCGRAPSDAHHLRFTEARALGRKVSDEFTVPLCRIHHRQVHDRGDEESWWTELTIDPLPIAEALWASTR
jgi:hypothetical protein